MTVDEAIATADRIKDRLRACETVAEIDLVAAEERATVRALAETAEGKPLAHQISNLKIYMLWQIRGR